MRRVVVACLLVGCGSSVKVGQQDDAGGVGGNGGGGGDAAVGDGPRSFSGVYIDPSAPPGARDAFGGAPSGVGAARPAVVYPLDGSMHGRNMGGMVVQWRAGAGNAVYRVRITGDMGEAAILAGAAACPGGKCRVEVPDDFWKMIAGANAGAAVTLAVDAAAAAGGEVATSPGVRLEFTPEDMGGGLYYWTTQLPAPYPLYTSGIMRVRLGAKTPETFLPPQGTYRCSGCHTVTRDGCRIALSYQEGDDLAVVDARDPTSFYRAPTASTVNTHKAAFSTWSPDGKELLTVKDGELVLRDDVGAVKSTIPRGFVGAAPKDVADHPEWSPDGMTIAFTRLDGPYLTDVTHSGDIMLMPVSAGAFGAARVLVAATADEYHYYPHFSPDSSWVVFNTGKRPGRSSWQWPADTPSSSYDQQTARLRMVPAAGGTPVELANATHGVDVFASWPKVSPFSQRGGNLWFIVFSSKIDYGWLVEQASIMPMWPSIYGRPQMWMAAIDPSRAGDPSFAPFWVPFQRTDNGNHLGYWTRQIVDSTAGGSVCK